MPKKKEIKPVTTNTPGETVAVQAPEVTEPVTMESAIPEGKVLANKDALNKLVERMDLLESQNAEMKREIAATADKAKLERYRSANTPKGGQVVRLGVLDGVVVTGWLNMPTNICEKNSQGRYYEDQTRILLMEDGTQREGAYSDFTKHLTNIEATITGRKFINTEIGQQEILLLAADNGKDYEIDVRFVNA